MALCTATCSLNYLRCARLVVPDHGRFPGPGPRGWLSQRDPVVDVATGALPDPVPEGAGYEHDELEHRTELAEAQRRVERRNADSHLGFMPAGLRTRAADPNLPGLPVPFADLDGENASAAARQTGVVGFTREIEVGAMRVPVPVSGHPIDSVNLREPGLGLYHQAAELVDAAGVTKGRCASTRARGASGGPEGERVRDAADVRRPARGAARSAALHGGEGLSCARDPRAIPTKTLGYAIYDLVARSTSASTRWA